LDCHEDIHKGQFAAAPILNRCEQCHTETSFKPSTLTIARHQKTSFPLTGSHMAVACIDCHKPMADGKTVAYHFNNLSCTTCHEDIHKGEFAERMVKLNKSGKPFGCEACHSTKTWNDLQGFDHAETSFPLLGTHRATACIDCHKPPNLEQTMLHVSFKAAPSQCEDCHENVHGPQFAKADNKTRCVDCHNSTKWKPSLFDHEKTAFSLKGAHENVACKDCHALFREVDGKKVLFYKPTPTACAACHGNDMKGSGKQEKQDN
jgi:nitrate/TMAO reductase-like tetraheme cytochrome c subunit